MKILFKLLIASAFVAFVASGCQKEQETYAPEGPQTIHFAIHAGSPATRTGIQYSNGSYTPYWNEGDELGVLFNLKASDNLKNDMVLSNTNSEGLEATFEGETTLDAQTGLSFYSYYPASAGSKGYSNGTIGLDIPSNQKPVYNNSRGYSFDSKADLLIAKPTTCKIVNGVASNEQDMYFARLSSVFRIELNTNSNILNGELVESVVFNTSSGDVAGRVVVNPATGEYSGTNSINGSKTLTATYEGTNRCVHIGTANQNSIFFSVAPVTIPAGSVLSFTINTVDSNGDDLHTITKTIQATQADIVFESSKPTVVKLNLSEENIENNITEFTLVESINDLFVGGEVIIAAADFNKALGTTQNSNNRSAVDVNKSNNNTIVPGSTVQVLTLASGTENNTFAFYTGDGYLTAASSSKNYLRTASNLDNNSSWSISIEDGVAKVIAQGSFTCNTLQYNNSSTIFACYASASQRAISLYIKPDSRSFAPINWDKQEATAGIGESFSAPTLTNNESLSVTYASSDEAVATINSNGVVDILTEGSTTISATYDGSASGASYKTTTVSYILTVVDNRSTVVTPSFSPAAGEVEANTNVTLSCLTEDATIYYTTDGTDPSSSNTRIQGNAVTIASAMTIKAYATKDGYKPSDVATATYTLKNSGPITDILNQDLTGVTGTSYSVWSGKKSNSSAVYAGQSATGNNSIQLRSNNNNSGIVTTTTGGKVTKIKVTWNSNTQSGRTLNIYGKNSAYSAATDLYSSSNQGTLLGTIVYGTSTELVVTGDYEYIGMRSASGAMYLEKVEITWE